jgi:hypothetical protein
MPIITQFISVYFNNIASKYHETHLENPNDQNIINFIWIQSLSSFP